MSQISQVTNALLTQLVMELKSGYLRRCESLGLMDEEMRMLHSLTVEDLHYLMNSPVSVLTLRIHHENFALMLQQARREQKRLQRLDQALMLGGSIELMQHYFGLTSVEVSSRRRMLGIEARQGRCLMLADKESAEVWRLWKTHVTDLDSADGLDVMMQAAEQLAVSLTAVWNAVRGWIEDEKNTVKPEVGQGRQDR
ncbi:hypothetical protein TI10_16290 [Photorhabdus luminescens subsp. luminescens]|uniref:DUF2857 domain-containing protein n=2 Tax=Photorhabdus TaxID=29487 RepID=A0A1G5R952_PHOLU|nr:MULTISPECIES: DUF2857 domain-containing protein [Photorhabdus]KMW72127.1 hypothetical protein TI10_16290 [Photorhabdus luminescens subsp. luminescens]MQL48783.1 DUF2857 family protein [Photorhabdus khanii]SCZ70398.1 Protein of unknown function [Photorhabdus luminescens]